MNTLLLLAALTSQITFQTATEGEMLTIIPQVTVTEPCLCQVQIVTTRTGPGGQSNSSQRNTLSLPANKTINLSRMTLNSGPNDRINVIVTVSDGKSLHITQQWPPSKT
ncbi:MAG: curli assembly chaperone CsgC [Silvania sp.]|uniref:Curli assembly protein CsgC n=1 Tax=Silvania hatchlandensis TaxID=2926469 RepID=A0A9J6PX78_9ENTR|nr:curli assembly chaperone CsgC [Silvania hatchlandensis]MCU6664080.1 curli assembly protein CsgC [Silvania hatchlandensis]